MLYHCTRKIRRIGLSGYRMIDSAGKDGNAMRSTPLDKFLGEERHAENPEMTLWDFAKTCNCTGKFSCGTDHAPVFTGIPTKPTWPVSEDYAKGQLMIFSKGTWKTPDDLKGVYDAFVEAFSEFLESDNCPEALTNVLQKAREKYEKKNERRAAVRNVVVNLSQQSSQQDDFTQTTDSQGSQPALDLGAAMLRDMAQKNIEQISDPCSDDPLPDGGPGFNWHEYGIQCLGRDVPDNAVQWLKTISTEAEKSALDQCDQCTLPKVNLRLANPLQRVVIAINLERLLAIKNGLVTKRCRTIATFNSGNCWCR